jgi:hypothetical protein
VSLHADGYDTAILLFSMVGMQALYSSCLWLQSCIRVQAREKRSPDQCRLRTRGQPWVGSTNAQLFHDCFGDLLMLSPTVHYHCTGPWLLPYTDNCFLLGVQCRDQMSDLEGLNPSQAAWKLPNPVYYIL